MSFLAGGQNLDVCSANINDQYVHQPGSWFSSGLFERGALGFDDRQQVVPGFHERLRALILQSSGQGIHVDTRLAELGQTFSAAAPSAAMIGPASPCSANAFSVASGIVLTVNGAARALM